MEGRNIAASRRRFLQFLAGSPLLAELWGQEPPRALSKPEDALEVMDFEEAAHRVLTPGHWGYLTSGVDDDLTRKVNTSAIRQIQLRPHRLVDVSKTDLSVEVFGARWDFPIFLCPVGGHKAYNPEGEVATARAARAKKTMQVLSTQTTRSVEDVAQALGTAPWYQLYMPSTWAATEKMVHRAEDAGCPVLAWTIDGLGGGRNTETANRFARMDPRSEAKGCTTCHNSTGAAGVYRPMFDGIPPGINPPGVIWDYVDRLKKLTKMKLVLKGIETGDDAKRALEQGVDGILVSNHGGRATEDLRPTIQSLQDVLAATSGRIPVFVDGGFRRGTDVYKALALGARAVGVGRPYIWGLAAFGQPGVERVLDILHAELQRTMRQCGTPTIAQITRAAIR